ncbi:hypothetical protein PHLGIDRAFT_114133 [Phlebiopsis gigantea 11061_1 CR5-6]|uniref:Uncharacterized protein n=1 Tax=Phlebiopsis gigantea (strain 11061_1 CR5-6) TaxID=745531 RepID=A0A0C3SFB7_PHLG1|nr:hypothetical protein PHLGIDRAFT_114133 [Phlebiopsis gigantea 11061_1 CR5-6]
MQSVFILAALAASSFAQRLIIQEPTAGQTITGNAPVTIEVSRSVPPTPETQGTVVIAVTPCYDVCSQPPLWPASQVVYDGPLNVQYNNSDPAKGRYEDITVTVPSFFQSSGAIISVAHQFTSESASGNTPLFEYTDVLVNIQ